MNKTYSITKINTPYKHNDNFLSYYIAVPCIVLDTSDGYNVALNINDSNECTSYKSNNGEYLNIVNVAKVYSSLSECKKEVAELNDKLVRQEIKDCSIFDARELSKTIRQALNYVENIQNSAIYNNQLVK